MNQDKKYSDVIRGEIEIINEELATHLNKHVTPKLCTLALIEYVSPYLNSIEQKTDRSSIDHINISTEIVDAILNKILVYTNNSYSESVIDTLSAQDTVAFYANQRENLMEALRTCRKLENMNMDYAYRIKNFNPSKKEIEEYCLKKV